MTLSREPRSRSALGRSILMRPRLSAGRMNRMPSAYSRGLKPPARSTRSARRSSLAFSAYEPGYITSPVIVTVRCSSKSGWRKISTLSYGSSGTSVAVPCAGKETPGGPMYRPAESRSNRSEEHTSELQSRPHLVCRLLLEKKKKVHELFRQEQPNILGHRLQDDEAQY